MKTRIPLLLFLLLSLVPAAWSQTGYDEVTIHFQNGGHSYRLEAEMSSQMNGGYDCQQFNVIQESWMPGTLPPSPYSLGTTGGGNFLTAKACIYAVFAVPSSWEGTVLSGWIDCDSPAGYECQAGLEDANGEQLWSHGLHQNGGFSHEQFSVTSGPFAGPLILVMYTFANSPGEKRAMGDRIRDGRKLSPSGVILRP